MLLEHYFTLFFSHFGNITGTIPLSATLTGCAKLCTQTGDCTSFFYNPNLRACLLSPTRHRGVDGLSSAHGYNYYILLTDCGPDWTEADGQCYLLRTDKLSARKAQRACKRLGGFLAKADSMADADVIKSFTKKVEPFWLGGTDKAKEGTWVWMDGSPIDPKFWKSRQPDNLWNEDCLSQDLNGFNDLGCHKRHSWLCEK